MVFYFHAPHRVSMSNSFWHFVEQKTHSSSSFKKYCLCPKVFVHQSHFLLMFHDLPRNDFYPLHLSIFSLNGEEQFFSLRKSKLRNLNLFLFLIRIIVRYFIAVILQAWIIELAMDKQLSVR